MTNLKKVILKKNSGNVTSLLIGQMLMLVLIIYCLFNFRLTMLNAVFNYIDDSLITSLLGGALVNVEEYGKSNQLVIHNNDRYEKTNTGTKADTQGWEEWEAAILLSELNYGSDITLTFKELEPKEVLSISNRDDYTYNLYVDYNFAFCALHFAFIPPNSNLFAIYIITQKNPLLQ